MTKEKITFSVSGLSETSQEEISLHLKLSKDFDSKKGSEKTNYLVYRAFQNQLKNERQGTRSTKTRAEVRGGGRKPWKQKGSGRARAGSSRSPLWKGGGVSFGPRPKTYYSKINRKEWRLALNLLLFKKQDQIKVVNTFSIPSQKTKDLVQALTSLNIDLSKKVLILVSDSDNDLQRPSKNLKNIKVLKASCLNIKELLTSKSILLTKNSLKLLEETYQNG